jgi:hypothetical protein
VRVTNSIPDPKPAVVWGLADSHAHLAAHLAFGGLIWGEPTGPLTDCSGVDHTGHGAKLEAAILQALEHPQTEGPSSTGLEFWFFGNSRGRPICGGEI